MISVGSSRWYTSNYGVKVVIVYALLALDILSNNAIEPPDGQLMSFYAITAYVS